MNFLPLIPLVASLGLTAQPAPNAAMASPRARLDGLVATRLPALRARALDAALQSGARHLDRAVRAELAQAMPRAPANSNADRAKRRLDRLVAVTEPVLLRRALTSGLERGTRRLQGSLASALANARASAALASHFTKSATPAGRPAADAAASP